jgi:hypothetical protein
VASVIIGPKTLADTDIVTGAQVFVDACRAHIERLIPWPHGAACFT